MVDHIMIPTWPAPDASVTGASSKGRERIASILAAARTVLIEKDYTQFSLRNVAATAGIHLSNLQYYFPSRETLIHALMNDVVREYDARYEERFALLPSMPHPRFVAMLDYLIEDIHEPRTRRFFVQLWALLERADGAAPGTLLAELYGAHIDGLTAYVAQLNPGLTPGRCRQRAAMIAAMIEGMMLMLRDADRDLAPDEPSIGIEMRRQLLRIAQED
jgi:AcrR family transcriptional regulator